MLTGNAGNLPEWFQDAWIVFFSLQPRIGNCFCLRKTACACEQLLHWEFAQRTGIPGTVPDNLQASVERGTCIGISGNEN